MREYKVGWSLPSADLVSLNLLSKVLYEIPTEMLHFCQDIFMITKYNLCSR